MKTTMIEKGKKLSYLLRHDKDYNFDEHGWREVSDLVNNHGYTIEEIDELVETNDKKRYEYNEDKTKIRARQGHSVNVDVELKEAQPPKTLYHGTSTRFLGSILREGILKMSRLYVHLSDNVETAIKVGKRHGSHIVLTINAEQMTKDGCKFWLSNNNVWLTEYVDPKYIKSY